MKGHVPNNLPYEIGGFFKICYNVFLIILWYDILRSTHWNSWNDFLYFTAVSKRGMIHPCNHGNSKSLSSNTEMLPYQQWGSSPQYQVRCHPSNDVILQWYGIVLFQWSSYCNDMVSSCCKWYGIVLLQQFGVYPIAMMRIFHMVMSKLFCWSESDFTHQTPVARSLVICCTLISHLLPTHQSPVAHSSVTCCTLIRHLFPRSEK